MLSLDAQEASYNAGQYSGQKKQYYVQNNMLNVKNNTAATSLLNFNDQSLAKKKKRSRRFPVSFFSYVTCIIINPFHAESNLSQTPISLGVQSRQSSLSLIFHGWLHGAAWKISRKT